jgi:hypothetical protein
MLSTEFVQHSSMSDSGDLSGFHLNDRDTTQFDDLGEHLVLC